MKIAVSYEDGRVFERFGRTENFMLYVTEGEEILNSVMLMFPDADHHALADMLKNFEVEAVICGGIGSGMRKSLDNVGIAVYSGAAGDADDAVQALIEGRLQDDPEAVCVKGDDEHHCHSHGDGCGCGDGCDGNCAECDHHHH